jgi:hypothetical protein
LTKRSEYEDAAGRPVHLGSAFVKHYLVRHDGALPIVTAVATLPMVLPNGAILAGCGLDRKAGIVFHVPAELQKLLPTARDCTDTTVADAMRFLTDGWLVDVATDYIGKCILAFYAAAADDGAVAFRGALELASGKALKVISATSVNWKLKALVDAPVQIASDLLTLRYKADDRGGRFVVDTRQAGR